MFTSNKRIERQIRRQNRVVPDDLSFEQAVGDDSHLEVEIDMGIDVARNLATEFEDVDTVVKPGRKRVIHQQHKTFSAMTTPLSVDTQIAA